MSSLLDGTTVNTDNCTAIYAGTCATVNSKSCTTIDSSATASIDSEGCTTINASAAAAVDAKGRIVYVSDHWLKKLGSIDTPVSVLKALFKGLGVVSLGSKMIDPPVVKRAVKLVREAREMGLLPEDGP